MTGFNEPNYTQTPNQLFDLYMRDMGEAELRVTLAVIRKTMGYHKDRDAISYSQIMEMTGLSRTSTQAGIAAAIEHGFIRVAGHGKRGVHVYELVVKPDQSTSTTSTGSVALPVTSSVTLPTKETSKRNDSKEKKRAPKRKTAHEKLIEQIEPYTDLAHAIMCLIEPGYSDMHKPSEHMSNQLIRKYLPHLEELKRLQVTPNELRGVYNHYKGLYEEKGWKFGVSTFEEKLPSYRIAKQSKAAAARPAPAPEPEVTEAQRAELLEAVRMIRPEWEALKAS